MFSTRAVSDRGFSRTRVRPDFCARLWSCLVTRPLMALLKAEMNSLKAELKLEFKTELSAVEKRLNERIDAWIVRR